MKKLILLILSSLTILGLISFSSCGYDGEFAAPQELLVNEDTLVLSWRDNSLVLQYTVAITNEEGIVQEKPTRKNNYDLSDLTPGEYTIKVMANEVTGKYKQSEWSDPIPFVRENESGLAYRLINSGTEYEVVGGGSAGSEVVVDDYFRNKPVTVIAENAFRRNSIIRSIVIGKNVKTIEDKAFHASSTLETVTFPEDCKVTSIGEKAFQSCSKLKSFSFPDGVTVVPENCFNYCYELESVDLGKNIRTISNSAFSSCRGLKSIVIPDSVVNMGESVFNGCNSLTSVVIGNNVETIGKNAFSNCGELVTLTIGEKVDVIGQYAFMSCGKVESVNIPESVSLISDYAFFGCTLLETITGMEGVEKIGQYAFHSTEVWNTATGLVYLNNWLLGYKEFPLTEEDLDNYKDGNVIKEGTVGVGDFALYGAYEWFSLDESTYLVIPNSVKYIGYGAFAYKDVRNPETGDPFESKFGYLLLGTGLVHIDEFAFFSHQNLQEVRMYDSELEEDVSEENLKNGCSLKKISANAFSGCTNLDSFDLPDSVEGIGRNAFINTAFCNKNEGGAIYVDNWLVHTTATTMIVEIKEGTVGIAEYGFYNNANSYLGVVMPDTVKYIGRAAFYKCLGLGLVGLGDGGDDDEVCFNISNSVERIEEYTFYGCNGLGAFGAFDLPENLQYIGRSAFNGTIVTDIVIPDSTTYIDQYAFYNCPALVNLTIGNGVKEIGDRAFALCINLNSVNIPGSVERIGFRAFYECANIEQLTLNEGIVTIDEYAFFNCAKIPAVEIPNSVEVIGKYAFRGCTQIETLTLGTSLRKIDDAAFFDCTSLESVIIPESVEEIGKYVFRNCKRLTSMIILGSIDSIQSHIVNGSNLLTIYLNENVSTESWNKRWNSAYRPIIWNAKIVDGYVESFVKTQANVVNGSAINGISEPVREGYTFNGWATTAGASEGEYSASELVNAPNGTTLYSTWVAN